MANTIQRHKSIIQVLREQKCDVCCLQEFWFNDNLRNLYQEELGHLYFISTLQRTRSEDGVAILLLKEKFHLVKKHDIFFREHSKFGHDRVALVVLAQLARQGVKSKCSPPLAFVTCHLTYPHHKLDQYSRLQQSKVLLRKSKEFIEETCPKGTPVVIGGDFNGTVEDKVSEEMRSNGFTDAFSIATGIKQSRITHCDHRKNQKGVDYIWVSHTDKDLADLRAEEEEGPSSSSEEKKKTSQLNMMPYEKNIRLDTAEAYLLPREVPCDTEMYRPKLSSLLPANTDLGSLGEGSGFEQDSEKLRKLTLNSYDSYENIDDLSLVKDLDWTSWCNMSDHRPMVVQFDLHTL